jgi:hypothetical protein
MATDELGTEAGKADRIKALQQDSAMADNPVEPTAATPATSSRSSGRSALPVGGRKGLRAGSKWKSGLNWFSKPNQ